MQINNSISIWNNPPAVTYAESASYLLDDYPAEQAYSVRLLRTAYSGALVRIRRDSDSAEKDFYPDSNNELSMSSEDGAGTSLSTWISTDSGYIVTWYNQGSDSGDDVTQATAANQPRIVNAGSLETKGGKAAVYFAGTNDILSTSITNIPEPFSGFGVASNDVSTGIGTILSTRSGATNEGLSIYNDRSTNKYLLNVDEGAANNLLSAASQDNTNNQKLISGILTAALGLEARKDGASEATTTIGDSIGTSNNFSIGAQAFSATYLTGHIQEVILYQSDETSNVTSIESDINTYYSIY